MAKLHKSSSFYCKRTQSGQGLVEGTIGVSLITAIVVAGTLLILGAGTAIYYKFKLAVAASVGAKYGGQGASFLGAKRKNYSDSQLAIDVRNAVNAALIGQGLPAAKSENITAKGTTKNGIEGMEVTVTEGGLEIISGGLLPSAITLTETAFYPYENNKPTAILGLSIGGTGAVKDGQGLFIPMYGGGSIAPGNEAVVSAGGGQGPVPTGKFPYWKVAVVGEKVPGYSVGATDYNDPSKLINTSRVEQFGTPQAFGAKK